jgi:succinate dehydrogenase / fumarate reductase flavoprotein subunit
VFGKRAGKDASSKNKDITSGKLTLEHIHRFEKELRDAGIVSKQASPMMLPEYRFEKALTSIQHVK